jgi:hypothetical protein
MWLRRDGELINLDLIYHIEQYDWNLGAEISYRIILRGTVTDDGDSPVEVHFKYKTAKERNEVFEDLFMYIDVNTAIRRFK